MGVLLVIGVVVTLSWGGIAYRQWEPGSADRVDRVDTGNTPASVRITVLRYLRGVAVALVGGFWAGALVTGPAVRLIMRLLAVTAGDDAQGRITEADEVVGRIELDGTIGLYVFGGVLPGLLSGAIYVLIRRWLPAGRLGGVVFGSLHLVVAATRIDPLRPDNPDFDLVGPGWLAVTTFGLTCLVHGMAVVAIANRYSTALPPAMNSRPAWIRVLAPLAIPAVFVVVPFVAGVLLLGLVVTIAVSRFVPAVRATHSRGALVTGRIAACVAVVALLPGMIIDLRDVIARDDGHPTTSPSTVTDGHDTATLSSASRLSHFHVATGPHMAAPQEPRAQLETVPAANVSLSRRPGATPASRRLGCGPASTASEAALGDPDAQPVRPA
jgi:hypothetical protein